MLECNVNLTVQLLFCRETSCSTLVRPWSTIMHAWKWGLVMVGLKGMGTRLLNHHVKKGNMMVMVTDLDHNLFPSTARFGASFCFH